MYAVIFFNFFLNEFYFSTAAKSGEYAYSKGKEILALRNKRIDSHVIKEFQCRSKTECLVECHSVNCDACLSVAFNNVTASCRLYKKMNSSTYVSTPEPAWKHYNIIALSWKGKCTTVTSDPVLCFDTDWCPADKGFLYNEEVKFCYHEINGNRSYAESVSLCGALDARLPQITSVERHNLLVDIMKNNNAIDGTFLDVYRLGMNFIWNCGKSLNETYTNWNDDQPQFRDEDEKLVASIKKYSYKWHDTHTSYKTGTICEFHKP